MSEADVSITYDLFSEAKTFLNSVVGREMMNDLANASEVLPLDEYMKIGMKIIESAMKIHILRQPIGSRTQW